MILKGCEARDVRNRPFQDWDYDMVWIEKQIEYMEFGLRIRSSCSATLVSQAALYPPRRYSFSQKSGVSNSQRQVMWRNRLGCAGIYKQKERQKKDSKY